MSHLLMLHGLKDVGVSWAVSGWRVLTCVGPPLRDCSHTEDTKLRPLRAPDSLSSSKAWRKGSGSIPFLATHPYLLAHGVQ